MSNDIKNELNDIYRNICNSKNDDYFPLLSNNLPIKSNNEKPYSLCYNMNENSTDTKYINKGIEDIKNMFTFTNDKCNTIINSNNDDKIKQLINTIKCINPYDEKQQITDLTPKQIHKMKNKPIICRRACTDTHFEYSSNEKNLLQDYCSTKINVNENPQYPNTASICNIIPQKPTN